MNPAMNPALFSLIARAGKASLDELRARAPVDENALVRDLATMLDEGVVVLSCDPGPSKEHELKVKERFRTKQLDANTLTVLSCIENPDEQDRIMTGGTYDTTNNTWKSGSAANDTWKSSSKEIIWNAINVAFHNPHVAECVMVTPTARGFKVF